MKPWTWTSLDDATLTTLRLEGYSAENIAARLGRSKHAVLTRAQRLGLPVYHRGWTADEDAELTRLWDLGWPSGKIATEMGKSKNSILGRRQRLSLPNRPSPAQFRKKPPEDTCHPSLVGDPGGDNTTPAQDTGDTGPIEQKRAKTCLWPIGDPREKMTFCGKRIINPKSANQPYCDEHMAVAYISKG